MKRFCVIGLGRFGSWVARALHGKGFDVIAIDQNEELVDRFTDGVTRAVAGNGTDPDLLRRVGVSEADAGVVSTGSDLAASILAVLALREVEVERVYVKVSGLRAAEALSRFDVDGMVFPEREAAERLAHSLSSTTILDYVQLGDDYSIQEMAIPDAWLGKTLKELELPAKEGVQIVGLHDLLTGEWDVVPDPDRPFRESDVAIVAGHDETLARLTREVSEK